MAFFVLLGGDDAGLDHFPVEVVAFTGALAHAGEDGETAVRLGDVVDELHDDDGLADAGTAEHAALAALEQRADEVDHLDAGGRISVLADCSVSLGPGGGSGSAGSGRRSARSRPRGRR
jgi:hypothetical protein